MVSRYLFFIAAILVFFVPFAAVCAQIPGAEQQKLDQDPTKVISRFGMSCSDILSVSGSLAFDPVRKINVTLKEGLDEWRGGGSWLFPLGIVTAYFGRMEFDNGGSQNNYSIGTFMPLSVFGLSPWNIQLFPAAGYTYNDGEIPCDTETNIACRGLDPQIDERFIMVSNESHSGYLGLFGLKQLSKRWTAMAALNGSVGTNDYSGWFGGGGVACQLSKRQSVRLMLGYIDNSYGSEGKVSVGYGYQFN